MIVTDDNNGFYFFQMAFFTVCLAYVLLQIYLYCYIGEKLLTQSTEIAYAAYDCEWYNMPAKEVKYLILIMRRAHSPLRITAGQFCSFNHELFSSILKTSMSYLSVLYNSRSTDVE
ncbi:hypothetical protein KPH14_004383 [Odynerus spinipes]|uniref:Uncharacterized protein n=1 Tax=Odynerus spinipes TaxID=1348599 RepID=A0AAD9RYP6_9HYME|nr:hypothetical protein KPH14_004383 [Odynerus spinipes]